MRLDLQQLKGEVLGYDKKTLAIVLSLIFFSGIVFYAGAKYEKYKLSRLGLIIEQPEMTVPIKEGKKQKDRKNAEVSKQNPMKELSGTIVSQESEKLVLKLTDGSEFSVTPFSIGSTIVIEGEKDASTGAITAKTIRVLPSPTTTTASQASK
jgi:hypothetical protein